MMPEVVPLVVFLLPVLFFIRAKEFLMALSS